MKKLLLLPIMILCLGLFSMQEAKAQNVINNTNCPFYVVVGFANFGTCNIVSSTSLLVPPGTAINVPVPAGTYLVASKGYESPFNPACGAYYVGRAGCGYAMNFNYGCTCSAVVSYSAPGVVTIN